MIGVDEAKSIIQGSLWTCAIQEMPLNAVQGLVLASDTYAPIDIPHYRQSAMDGYALAFTDKDNSMEVVGEVPAGATQSLQLRQGQATRIFTGAPLPEGADTVVMQEKIEREGDRLRVLDSQLRQGANVRQPGDEIVKGALALPAGSVLSPAAAGFLASIGIAKVPVFLAPRITLIVTGNELQPPGEPLGTGGVYESNSVTIGFALRQMGVRELQIRTVRDQLEDLIEALREALEESEIVILTGGVSVGDYDFVAEAAAACGVEKKFHGVKQKPGKPLYFGKKDSRQEQPSDGLGESAHSREAALQRGQFPDGGDEPALVFGLPGNPASALTCFYIYVQPAIEAMQRKQGTVRGMTAAFAGDYQKRPGLTYFLKGKFTEGKVTLLSGQESFRLHSFAQANCLVRLEEGRDTYQTGDAALVYMLPT